MASYDAVFRTNYFHVTDERRYVQIMTGFEAGNIHIFDKKDDDGNILHGFGAYTSLDYFPAASFYEEILGKTDLFSENGAPVSRSDMDDYEELFDKNGEVVFSRFEEEPYFDDFLKQIQKILPEEECFAMIQTGNEKLRYITGVAFIVTREQICSVDLNWWLQGKAAEMLGDSMENSCACEW